MSSSINDENTDSQISFNSQMDSGYFSFTSPCRLSPLNVIYTQHESPISEDNSQLSITQKFDYENYINTRKYFDILIQLNHRNTFHLIDKIFRNLSNKDLISCLFVCKKWNLIIKDFHQRQQTKSVKRNLFNNNDNNNNNNHTIKLTSTPMKMITNKMPMKPIVPLNIEDDDIYLTASTMTFRYGYLKYLHGPTITKRCPICSFVSIVDVNDQHGICTNPLCGNNFCQCCSGPYHPSSPCKTTTGPIRSPWRKRASISPIFSNKTRSNLRRLLI